MRKLKNGIIMAVVIVVVIMIVIAVMGIDRDGIVDQYYALSNKPGDSTKHFRVPFGYVTVDSDGSIKIEFADSLSTISTDIDVDDDSEDGASGDDDRQGGEGTGTGTDPNPGGSDDPEPGDGGGVAEPPKPDLSGDELIFPEIGEDVWFSEINTKKTGTSKRTAPDIPSWEFAWQYISTTNNPDFQTMKRRASKIAPYLVNPSSHDVLKVNLGGEEYSVGCLPIDGFGKLGDIVEFTFDNGSTLKVLGIDAKSSNDTKGKGAHKQCNTHYCHAYLKSDGLHLSAVELWCGGDTTEHGNTSSWPKGNVVKAKIIGHWDGFN